ncbi:ABC transporter ATP-binding protein [Pannonibacter carbonis]|uniref:ABC transporter ATP-binding protein n=1 Tax=Pannonibacter carbonis TaxID=2067569 RepID=UPI000D108BC3|nr:ABC transporter ATP-binding protein [Pannonibacter carbonis]
MADTSPILALEKVSKTFITKPVFGPARRVEALRRVSLTIQPGKALALVGESGSGKSTVGRLIVRHYAPTDGRILFEGQDIEQNHSRALEKAYQRSVQMVFQDPFSALNPAHTIRHHLIRPLRLHQPDRDPEQAMLELLGDVELDPKSTPDKYPHELSGGQRQRVNFARALAVNARLIVADEPTSMLDVSIRKSVLGLMRRLKDERGLALLYITHDIATAQYLAEETAVMFRGQIVEQGPTAEVVGAPRHAYTQLLRAAVPDPAVRLGSDTTGFAERSAVVRTDAARDVVEMATAGNGHFFALH